MSGCHRLRPSSEVAVTCSWVECARRHTRCQIPYRRWFECSRFHACRRTLPGSSFGCGPLQAEVGSSPATGSSTGGSSLAAGSSVAADVGAVGAVRAAGPHLQPGRVQLVPRLRLVPHLLLIRVQLVSCLLPSSSGSWSKFSLLHAGIGMLAARSSVAAYVSEACSVRAAGPRFQQGRVQLVPRLLLAPHVLLKEMLTCVRRVMPACVRRVMLARRKSHVSLPYNACTSLGQVSMRAVAIRSIAELHDAFTCTVLGPVRRSVVPMPRRSQQASV
jgi:hypothetical protein